MWNDLSKAQGGRRAFLQDASLGFGALALAHLLAQDRVWADSGTAAVAQGADLRPRPAHHAARATSVIMLMQVGGPSHVDLFDPKPELTKRDGQEFPESI